MKRSLLILVALVLGQNASAGDAGYFSRTCISSSQRTVLTVLNDYSDSGAIYTLVLDGVPAVYNLKDNSVKETGDDGVLTISKNNVDVLRTAYTENNGKLALTVYVDPRAGTIAEHDATPTPISVQLQCKDYWPNP